MILDRLEHAERYFGIHPLFPAAFRFLRRADLAKRAPGRLEMEGDRLFALVAQEQARRRTEARLEAHRRYIDIQLVLAGAEQMGWKGVRSCTAAGVYDPERDIQFFDDAPVSWCTTPAGAFCVFFPEDAHAPLVGEGDIHKIVVKVACEEFLHLT